MYKKNNSHDVTVMNPKLDALFLTGTVSYILHEQFFGFHSFIPFLNSFNSIGTTSQILGPKYKILSLPWKTDLMFAIKKSELIRKL